MRAFITLMICMVVFMSGCTSKKASSSPDVYKESEINKRQEIRAVNISKVDPAKIAINNDTSKNTARVVGGVLGAVGGAVLGYNWGSGKSGATVVGSAVGGALGGLGGEAVNDEKVVDGVTITYEQDGRVYSSTQVGDLCEYKTGSAEVVLIDGSVTKIQPNSYCY
ncbi:MAG: hypothetical protein GXZ15_00485 [Campylobacter sp.]|nr:hypothetical protein [Campylobacter sp.]